MSKEILSKNIKSLLDRKGVTQTNMAHDLNISESTVSSWLSGTKYPRRDKIELMADYFNVVPSEITDEQRDNRIYAESIPVLGRISAGIPLYSEQQILRYSFIPSHINKIGKELFYLEVTGDSMDKEFPEGSEVLVDANATVENGQIAVVQINGYDATVKKVRYDGDNIILLPMSNNEIHLPQIYSKDDEVLIIGRVIGMFKEY
ncbi:LexA family protein [Macrococcoides caseolyticum]|uniref:LexA family protein n=1 Tax=Macrococcoides caseolyticum TaxID=69966 RepID=UPI001F2BAC18|nr:XRE family transcriptional regulator [Macrococcus caseolyticus]